MRNGGGDVTWSWDGGVRSYAGAGNGPKVIVSAGGPLGLLAIALVAGVISGVAEALGTLSNINFGFLEIELDFFRSRIDRRQS